MDKKTEKKNRGIALGVTILALILAFLLMAFCGLTYQIPPPQAKKVILIEMVAEIGGGGGGGNVQSNSRKPTRSSAEKIQTQRHDVSLPSIPTSEKKNPDAKADQSSQMTDPTPNPNAAYRPGMGGGSGGGSGSGRGSGTGAGLGTGTGSGSGGGIGMGTGNRAYTHMPDLTINEVGKVYVQVHVLADGTVKDAQVITSSKYPTTITNSRIQASCVAKAKTARYKEGKEEFRIIVFSL